MYRQGVLLSTAALVCLATVVGGTVQRFAPAWQPAPLIVAIGLIALEAGVVHHVYRRERMWTNELVRYLVPELLIMTVIMRVAASLSLGGASVVPSLQRWLYDPLSIFDLPFVLALIVGLLVAVQAHTLMQALRTLEPQEFEQATLSGESLRLSQIIAHDRAEALRQLSSAFVGGGVIVLLALGLETVNTSQILASGRAISTLSALGALFYLVSGFLLYSQARLALLRTRWRLDGATVSPLVVRRWNRSSWLLVGGVTLAAVFLPRTYGMGLLDTLRAALGIVGYIFAILGYAVIWLFGLLALIPALLLALLGGNGSNAPPPRFEVPPQPPLPPAVTHEPSLLPALLFWLCMLLLVIYALMTIVQRHPLLVERIFNRGPLRRFSTWLKGLWGDTRSWATLAATAVRERIRRATAPAMRPGFIRLGALAPRDLVRYFYRSTLRRAAASGVARRAGQTPYEFGGDLARAVPEAEQDIAALTESFVAAQYSQRPIDHTTAQRTRGPWQRLRDRLRAAVRSREQKPDASSQKLEARSQEPE